VKRELSPIKAIQRRRFVNAMTYSTEFSIVIKKSLAGISHQPTLFEIFFFFFQPILTT
jgi:hypothetical protein